MRRTALATLALCVLVLALAGCGGDPKPKHAQPSPPAPTPSASVTPTPADPVPPVMPTAAKQHTVAGARAFIRYFWQVTNYSQATLDTSHLEPLLSGGCSGCQGALKFLHTVAKARGTVHGGLFSASDLRTTRLRAGKLLLIRVKFKITSTRQVVDYPGKRKSDIYKGGTDTDQFELLQSRSGWTVISWVVNS